MTFKSELEKLATMPAPKVSDLSDKRTAVLWINPMRIKIKEGRNLRNVEDPEIKEHIKDLGRDIMEQGMQHPLIVEFKDGECFMVDGECRIRGVWYALDELGAEIASVPCMLEPKGTTEGDRIAKMAKSYNGGKPIKPLELAKGVQRLITGGWTHDNIAKRLGMTTQRIYQLVDLALMPIEVRDAVTDGSISATAAAKIMHEEGATEGAKTITAAIKEAKADAKNGKGKGKVKSKHVAKSRASGPTTVSSTAKELATKSKVAKMLAERIEVIKTAFARGTAKEASGRVAVLWSKADYDLLTAKLGMKEPASKEKGHDATVAV